MEKKLAARGMTVLACPLGTGIVIEQATFDGTGMSVHLTSSEARELLSALAVSLQLVNKPPMTERTLRSLFVQGLRVDQIAAELNLPTAKVLEELIARGLLKQAI